MALSHSTWDPSELCSPLLIHTLGPGTQTDLPSTPPSSLVLSCCPVPFTLRSLTLHPIQLSALGPGTQSTIPGPSPSLVLSCCPVPFTLRSLTLNPLHLPPPALGPGTRLADSLIRRPSILCRPLCSANLMLVDHKAYCFQSAYTIITGSSEREQCPGDECGEAS